MDDQSRDLATRRGRPLNDYGALFPNGGLWRWILGASYAGLMVLEAIGNESWRVAATPYLDIGVFVGLIPTIWVATRPPTQHTRNAQMRATTALLTNTPQERALLADYGLLDQDGKLIDEAPPAWVDELTPEPQSTDWLQVVLRAIVTPVLAFATWIAFLFGLEVVDWAREHWIFVLPVLAVIALPFVQSWLSLRREAPTQDKPKT